MKLVVDANILFSALIKDSTTRRLFFEEEFELYAPEYLFEEFAAHKGGNSPKIKTNRGGILASGGDFKGKDNSNSVASI